MSSGQQWGTVVGGIVGAWVGSYSGNTMQGAQIGMAIGGYAGSVIDPTIIKGPSLGDASAQTSLGGAPIPKVYGHSPPIAPTLIDGDKVARKIKRQEDVGKGATSKTENEAWIATRAFLVCEGEITGYARITRNGKLVYSTMVGDQIDGDSASFANQITIYTGSETQGPDPSLEAIHGVGNTPYYRGRSYFVVRDDDETQTGGAANQYRVEVIASGESETVCTELEINFIHGYTGTSQSIFDTAMSDKVLMTAGWNNNLRRSTDRGQSWRPVDYLESTDWLPGTAIGNIWYSEAENNFYMAIYNEIAFGGSGGIGWSIIGAPRHFIVDRSVGLRDGQFWAGASNTDSSIVFDVMGGEGANEVDYGDHGLVCCIAQLEGVNYVGTDTGEVLNAPDVVVFEDPSHSSIRCMIAANGIYLIGLSGGYARSLNGVDFDIVAGETTFGLTYALGMFWRSTTDRIYSSPDGSDGSWVERDDYFEGNNLGTYLISFYDVIFGATQDGLTAVSPILYQLPDIAGAYVDADGNIMGICNEIISGDSAVWRDVVSDIAWRASPLLPDQLDIDHMTDLVPGFVLGNAQLTGTGYVRTLCTFYFTDGPEYDGEIHFVRRGGPIVATFTDNDMLVVEDEDDDTREQAVDGIKRLTIMYPEPANQYVPTPQTSPRTSPDVTASNNVTIECPIPFDADTMAQKADILQKIAFLPLEGGFKRAMPAEFSKYVSSDPIMFNDRRYLIGRTSNDDSMVRFEATYDRVSAYTSRATGSTGPAPTPQTSNLKGPTMFWGGNLPRLRSADNSPGLYVGACGLLDGWPGADLYVSVDGGLTEQLVLSMTNEATIGSLVEDCTASSEPITVRIFPHGELHSITPEQMAARQNAFAMTTADVSEVAQFMTATGTSNGDEYELTDVERGLLDTVAAPHSAGEPFVVLDGDIYFLPLDSSLIGKTLIFRPVTKGTVPANNQTYSILFQPLFTGPEDINYLLTEAGAILLAEDGTYLQAET